MKNRNLLLLGLLAMLFAVGGAYASVRFTSYTAKVEITSLQNTAWHCIDSNKTCEDSGNQQCRVTVDIDDPPLPPTSVTVQARNSSCVVSTNTNDSPTLFNPSGETVTGVR